MRHAAPASRRPLGRTALLILATLAYTVAGLAIGLITLAAALTAWGFWQWLGVN